MTDDQTLNVSAEKSDRVVEQTIDTYRCGYRAIMNYDRCPQKVVFATPEC